MFKKTLLTTTALSVLASSVALAEIKMSGSMEFELGQANYTDSTNAPKITGSETVIAADGGGDLGGGNSYKVHYEFSNASNDTVQANLNFGAAEIELGVNGSAGIEDVKALLPFVNNRIQDIGGTTFGANLTDNTSSTTYFAVNAKTGNLGAVSIAYNPNEANTKTTGATDGIVGTASTGSSVSGSFKGSLGVEGLTVGVGYLKHSNPVTANDDKKAETVGFSYNAGSFAVGYQRMKQIQNALASATKENTIDLYGASYKVADNLSVGVYQINDTLATEGSSDVELSSTLLSIGYNLGAAKVSYDYITADNHNYVAGTDATLHRVKVGMAF